MDRDWSEVFAKGKEKPLRVHLIGVAGSGMSGLASLFMALGHRVSGSDRVSSKETQRLQGAGLIFSSPHSAQVVEGVDVVVRSSAIKVGNAAYDAAVTAGLPVLKRAEALAAIMNGSKGIVVAGTHGKTTTSAMLAHVLRLGGLRPSHYVGAEIPILGANAHWEPEGEWFVAEGDESDGSLVNFAPVCSILLNVEEEHLDFYDGIEAILAVFTQLLDQTSRCVVYCAEDEWAKQLCEGRDGVVSYGWKRDCDYSAENLRVMGGGTAFDWYHEGELVGELRLNIPGKHNVLNALAAAALATELGVSFNAVAEALQSFRGARRRFEVKYESSDFVVVDDYGHHPTEIAATIAAARERVRGRLVCVFQPHRYSRTQLLRDDFGRAFDGVDALYVADIYPASELPIEGVSGLTIVQAVEELGEVGKVISCPSIKDMHQLVGADLIEGDLILSLGAGDVHEVTSRLSADIEILEALRSELDEAEGRVDLYEPMSRHTTLKVGGPAQFWVEPTSIEGFARVVKFCRARDLPLRVVGRGSNLLVGDGGIAGVVVCPVAGVFAKLVVEGEQIQVGGGVRLKRLTAAAQAAGLGGLEWMEGIPGNVGGAIRMNAGAMGAETFDCVVSVTYVDGQGEIKVKTVEQIEHRYRNVPEFTDNYVVEVVFQGRVEERAVVADRLATSKLKRKEGQPVAASAGCVFKNPEQIPAGKLVEELGYKNRSVGAARVSEVHGNFIVNDGGATAADVLMLIEEIQLEAKEQRGIVLETEVQILGQQEPV
ncbi:MAG: UDP-N-acetylmuramate--L-alanine ligase [Verrucomicrobiales bacterium]|nr:UDP-N-acetylmuramate--L-alanine ligase [Verrucomicrobiales bacterium]